MISVAIPALPTEIITPSKREILIGKTIEGIMFADDFSAMKQYLSDGALIIISAQMDGVPLLIRRISPNDLAQRREFWQQESAREALAKAILGHA